MEKLYDNLKNKFDNYRFENTVENEKDLIDSLDEFVSELKFDSIIDTNKYRNNVLILISENFLPDNYNQFKILMYQFFNKKIENPIMITARQIKLDLEKDYSERDYSNCEWEAKLNLVETFGRFWNRNSFLMISDVYNNIFKDFPRTGILQYLDYGLNQEYIKGLNDSFSYILGKTSYLENAEKSLCDKLDNHELYRLKYCEPEVYSNMLFEEIENLYLLDNTIADIEDNLENNPFDVDF